MEEAVKSSSVSTNCTAAPIAVEGDNINFLADLSQSDSVLPPETVSQFARCVRGYIEEHPFDSGAMRLGSGRIFAHERGNCYSNISGEKPIFALLAYDDIRTLEGRLLTIIDASFTDRTQRKAVRDLVRNAIWFDWAPNLDTDNPSHGKPDLDRA